jgi:hypothetical protein
MTETVTGPPISDDEIRSWAKATGRAVSDRGRIGAELRAEYERMAAAADTALPDDDAVTGRVAGPGAGAPVRPARDEARPRKVKPPAGWRGKLWGGQGGAQAKTKARAKPKLPRVPVDRLIERGWDVLARVAQPVNLPVSRVLAIQAPAAGLMLEDVVRGTVVDLVLQPIARAEAKLEVVGALAGPPLLVLALQLPHNQPYKEVTKDGQKMMVPSPAGAIRQTVLMSALEESLMMWDDVTRERMEEVRARVQANEARRAQVKAIIEEIFAPTDEQAAAAAAAMAAEDQAVARARQRGQ